jgi:hypothetical protein
MEILPNPIPNHPRLFASSDDWQRIREQIQFDPVSARLWTCLRRKADRILLAPSIRHVVDGQRLLAQSRLCIQHVVTLAMVAVISGDHRYTRRAIDEMCEVARFSDWNPPHFLDTAEMATALAIGFDWLFDHLGEHEREAIAGAIKDKALQASFESPPPCLWWVAGVNNWNQVCHSGLSVAAMAVAEIYPEWAERTIRRALENLPKAAHSYAPDGAYAEGPMYWDYGTTYHVLLAAMLEHASGSTQGMDQFPGFAESAEYMTEVTAPSGLLFNYCDCDERRIFSIPLFWFARRYRRPEFLRYELTHLDACLKDYEQDENTEAARFLALSLLWHDPTLQKSSSPALPLNWAARGANPVAVFRTAWDDDATFVGLKGGSPRDPHAQMDAGSFVLESDGVRWAIDPAKQDYGGLEKRGIKLWDASQTGDRWKIFRLGASAHNIPRFNGADQCVDGRAEFNRFEADGASPFGIVNLDSIYRDQVDSAQRGIALLSAGFVLIQDEWTAGSEEVTFEWQMLTRAEVVSQVEKVILRQEGKSLTLEFLASSPMKMEVCDVSKPIQPHDVPNPGVRKIRVSTMTGARERGMLRCIAIPGSISPPCGAVSVTPLTEW